LIIANNDTAELSQNNYYALRIFCKTKTGTRGWLEDLPVGFCSTTVFRWELIEKSKVQIQTSGVLLEIFS